MPKPIPVPMRPCMILPHSHLRLPHPRSDWVQTTRIHLLNSSVNSTTNTEDDVGNGPFMRNHLHLHPVQRVVSKMDHFVPSGSHRAQVHSRFTPMAMSDLRETEPHGVRHERVYANTRLNMSIDPLVFLSVSPIRLVVGPDNPMCWLRKPYIVNMGV